MFRGNYPTRLDEKGRLKVPAEFLRVIEELYDERFFITSTDGRAVDVYPMREWEKIEAERAQAASSQLKHTVVDGVPSFGQAVELDAQGRLLLPEDLRAKAGLAAEVAVLGVGTMFRVVEDRAADLSGLLGGMGGR